MTDEQWPMEDITLNESDSMDECDGCGNRAGPKISLEASHTLVLTCMSCSRKIMHSIGEKLPHEYPQELIDAWNTANPEISFEVDQYSPLTRAILLEVFESSGLYDDDTLSIPEAIRGVDNLIEDIYRLRCQLADKVS